MESDDDLFVVIVGNAKEAESGKTKFPLDIQIKEEVIDDCSDIVNVEDIIEVASKYGEVEFILPDSSHRNDMMRTIKTECSDDYFHIKVEEPDSDHEEAVLKNEDHYIGEEGYITGDLDNISDDRGDANTSDDDYIPGFEFVDSDDDFIPEEDDHDEPNEDDSNSEPEDKVIRVLKPREWKSFVKKLKSQDPKLRSSSSMLINTLVQIMKDVKRPPPPENYYVINDSRYECVKCGAQTETNPAAWRHYQEKHGQRYLVCFACGMKFRSTTNLYKHEKRCAAPDASTVLKARALFLGRKGRSRPFLPDFDTLRKIRTQNKRRFPCKLCSAVFNSKNNLQSHERLHRGERPYRCHACPAAYTGASALRRHLAKHSNIKYICDHCNRQFISKATLVTHMDTHLPEPRFSCDMCEKRYATKAALKLHVHRIHLNLPPPAACQICPRRYPRMSVLKSHMKNDHGMILMTRRMFFKSLPSLSDAQLKQAKLVLKSDVPIVDVKQEYENINKAEAFLNEQTGLIECRAMEIQSYNGVEDLMAQPISYVLTEMEGAVTVESKKERRKRKKKQ